MRAAIYTILTTDPALVAVLGDRWVQAAAGDGEAELDILPRPFGVFRISGTFAGMGKSFQRSLELWIHDDPGSYTRIDGVLRRLRDYLPTVEQYRHDETDTWIQEISWVNDSPDLFDDARRTNTKMASFNLVGSGE